MQTRIFIMIPRQIAPRQQKPASINDGGGKRECGLFGEDYRLYAGDFETLAAAHVLASHKIIFTQHVGARLGEAGAIPVVGTSRELPFLGANDPGDLILRRLMTMRAIQRGHLLLRPLVKEFFFVHGSYSDYCISKESASEERKDRVKLSLNNSNSKENGEEEKNQEVHGGGSGEDDGARADWHASPVASGSRSQEKEKANPETQTHTGDIPRGGLKRRFTL